MVNWNLQALKQIAPNAKRFLIVPLAKQLNKLFEVYGLTNPLEQAHFIAQIAHETADFRTLVEYGDRDYFKPYEGRKDLGNVIKGDGYKYRGRGFIMLTGRYNYTEHGFRDNPERLEQFKVAIETAFKYWLDKNIRKAALADNINKVTRLVNGGRNGLKDRKKYLRRCKAVIRAQRTDSDSVILAKLGYKKTLQDILNFQKENGLVTDGIIGPITRSKMADLLNDKSNRSQNTTTITGVGGVSVGLIGETLKEAADQIEPLQHYMPTLQIVFTALTLAGTVLLVWSLIQKNLNEKKME